MRELEKIKENQRMRNRGERQKRKKQREIEEKMIFDLYKCEREALQ